MEYALILSGGNVIAGFEALEQAVSYARETWGTDVPDGYAPTDPPLDDPDSPVIGIFEVTRLSDWKTTTLR